MVLERKLLISNTNFEFDIMFYLLDIKMSNLEPKFLMLRVIVLNILNYNALILYLTHLKNIVCLPYELDVKNVFLCYYIIVPFFKMLFLKHSMFVCLNVKTENIPM